MTNENNIEINDTVLMSYINAELSATQLEAVERWLTLSSENQDHFDQLKKTWEISGNINPEPVSVNADLAWQNVLAGIQKGEEKETKETKVIPIQKKSSGLKYLIGVAAMLAIIFTIYTTWNSGEVEQINLVATTDILNKKLSDGSEVTVNKSSQLTYPESFNKDERRVKLEGEAFFEIKRDEEHPFIVDLPQESYVKVLGTSFNINTSDDNATTTVYVKTGKVEFGTEQNNIILVAGEKGIMDIETGEVYKEVDEINEVTTSYWINEELRFDNDKIEDVVRILSEIYDVKIDIKCDEAREIPVVHTIEKGSDLEVTFEVLSEIYNFNIQQVGGGKQTEYSLECNEN